MSAMAPHLPPPSCSVETHTRLTRLKLFFLTVVIALFTGMIGALLMVNAWYPTGLSNSTVLVPNRTAASPTLSTSVIREWRHRVIELFDATKIQQGKYYTEAARLTQAVVVNAGGWSVAPLMPMPHKTNLVGLDYQGHRLTVEQMIVDEPHKLLFIKFSGADFRADSVFASPSFLQPGRIVWGLSGDWQAYTIGPKNILANTNVAATLDTVTFSLSEPGAANRLLVTDRGEFVGFTDTGKTIIPVWMVGHILPQLLSSQAMPFLSFEWRGTFVDSVATDGVNQELGGFLVQDVERRNSKFETAVKKGDIVTKIQNQTVTRDNLAELLWSAPAEFSVTVIRAEKTINLIIKK